MSLRRIGNVTINQVSPALETIASEFPTTYPDPYHDLGRWKRHALNPVLTLPAGFDRVLISSVVEDPIRNRLLGIGFARLNGTARNHGRRCLIWEMPWGHPEGPYTLLNDTAGGDYLIPVAADWAAACQWNPSGCVDGNMLYIAFNGDTDDAVNSHNDGTSATQRFGLAKLNLATTTDYVATKLTTNAGQLQLGTSPYEGHSPQIFKVDGTFHLWVAQHAGATQQTGNNLFRDFRLYRSAEFDSTAAKWKLAPGMKARGDGTVWTDTHFCVNYLGNSRWLINCNTNFWTFAMEGDRFRLNNLGAIWGLGTAGQWDDNIAEIHAVKFHGGKWHMLYAGNDAGGGSFIGAEVGYASYEYDQQDFNPTPAQVELPFCFDSSVVVSSYNSTTETAAAGYVDLSSASIAENKFEQIERALLENPTANGYMGRVGYVSGDYAAGKFRIYCSTPTHSAHTHTHGDPTTGTVNSAVATTQVGKACDASTAVGTYYYRAFGRPI